MTEKESLSLIDIFKKMDLLPESGFGTITFTLQGGKIVFYKKEETRKPTSEVERLLAQIKERGLDK